MKCDFFKNLSESSYWAGFIAGDGCIRDDRNYISIALKHDDILHLEKLKNTIECTNNVITYVDKNNYKSARLLITHAKELILDLKNNFNITPRKSLTLISPNLFEINNIRDFIRGLLDSDGCISYNTACQQWSIDFLGTNQVLNWIKIYIEKSIKNIGNPTVLKHKNIFRLSYTGRQTVSILDWIYFKSTVYSRLERKYNKYLELKEYKKYQKYSRGISWISKRNKWQASIFVNNKTKFLGYYNDAEEAQKIYNEYALALLGTRAKVGEIICV